MAGTNVIEKGLDECKGSVLAGTNITVSFGLDENERDVFLLGSKESANINKK